MQRPQSGELQTMFDERVRSRRCACSADRNMFSVSDRVIKCGAPAICDRGEGFILFVRSIRRGVANGPRSAFHNSELRAGEVDCLVKAELTAPACLPLG